ncbi:TetR/AcrR family transcriptional regulator [Amnibacterium setariae]|uniref:TetR/AcrR family transcriptional regulator n=1 Tax=Amnibacterium setariae TaxID=2306585 RepID=A0A3A1U2E1_9MICO|nr:TetR/AcrR family transcriptional regulator [Amnibacterium setariae]RIX28636.1 TetR/AcrR family transcriptional regulator [Amnibacterium setariae]
MPRITREQKQLNRDRIVSAASQGFKLHGVDGIGIQDLMATAGMTNGGFYNHFPSKEALVLEVYEQGFADSLAALGAIRDAHPRSARAAYDAMVDAYVAADHRDHPETGCPSAALPVDAGRHGEAPQEAYRTGLEGYITAITAILRQRAEQEDIDLSPSAARTQAIALFSQMVGAVILARAVAQADPALSDEVLTANRKHLKRDRQNPRAVTRV